MRPCYEGKNPRKVRIEVADSGDPGLYGILTPQSWNYLHKFILANYQTKSHH